MSNPEYSLQVHVIRYLDGKIKQGRNVINVTPPFPEIQKSWHVYQGRSEDEGFFLKEMGVRPGVHDVHILYKKNNPQAGDTGYGTIELKVGKNKQSDYQRDFTSKMITCGHKTDVCYSVAEVRDTLIKWGLECKNPNAIEPPRPLEERRQAVHNFYGRPDIKIKTLEQVFRECKED